MTGAGSLVSRGVSSETSAIQMIDDGSAAVSSIKQFTARSIA
jgi:hypothetical protein